MDPAQPCPARPGGAGGRDHRARATRRILRNPTRQARQRWRPRPRPSRAGYMPYPARPCPSRPAGAGTRGHSARATRRPGRGRRRRRRHRAALRPPGRPPLRCGRPNPRRGGPARLPTAYYRPGRLRAARVRGGGGGAHMTAGGAGRACPARRGHRQVAVHVSGRHAPWHRGHVRGRHPGRDAVRGARRTADLGDSRGTASDGMRPRGGCAGPRAEG
jgi:hypothetical protein